ncbi:MAG: ABC transporter permease [Phycisphaerae bacterium]|nr:ABC transporter permease [Phycisphaerae bacterium]
MPPASETTNTPEKGRSLWGDAWRRLRREPSAMICLGVIAAYVLIALGGMVYTWVAEMDNEDEILPLQQMVHYERKDQPPRLELSDAILGTDWAGKSTLYKVLLGAKTSLTVGLMANIIAVPVGLALGAIAGYYGKAIDDGIVWLYTTLSCIPGIVLLIALKYTFQDVTVLGLDLSGIHGLYIALGVVSWIGTCRLVRAETMKIRELDYVAAARAIGTPGPVILLRHVLPNVFHIAIIRFSLGFVTAIKSEVILSYLGLGVKPGVPSWGNMIDSARMDLFMGRWWELSFAVAAIFVLVLALSIFGDRLRDALDPRLRNV